MQIRDMWCYRGELKEEDEAEVAAVGKGRRVHCCCTCQITCVEENYTVIGKSGTRKCSSGHHLPYQPEDVKLVKKVDLPTSYRTQNIRKN
jgi:hypothetical protein